MNKNNLKHLKGFSLIEILVVLAIIGILLSFVVPSVINRPDEAKVIKAKNDLNVLESALTLYKLDHGDYPEQTLGLEILVNSSYIKSLPLDPWGGEYQYRYPGVNNEIDIFTYGADQVEGGEGKNKDIGNWVAN